jgi:hypothetical protein
MMNKQWKNQLILHSTRLLSGLILLLMVFSCQKSGSDKFIDQVVVEAYLAPAQKISLTISRKTPYEEGVETSDVDINNVDVRIQYHGSWYSLAAMGEGVYTDTSGIIPVLTDTTYNLAFSFNGGRVTSSTIIPRKPASVTQSVTTISMAQFDPDNTTWTKPPDPVEITFANDDQSYYLVTVDCIETTLVPVYKDSIPANDVMSSQPVTGTQINIQPMTIRYFGRNRIILYHINPEYSTFFMHQSSNSQNYQQPPSNIDNGLGIFTGVNADTLFLDVVELK